jgi:hypothetical protein
MGARAVSHYATDKVSFISVDLIGRLDAASIVRAQAQTGMIDSMWCYVDADDEHPWFGIGGDRHYGHSDTCLRTMKSLLRSRWWHDLTRGVDTVVDLGVGDGSKVAEVVRALVQRRYRELLRVGGLDISATLLREFRSQMFEIASRAMPRFEVLSAQARFVQLGDVLTAPAVRGFSGREGRRLFLLLGNTFGNIHEPTFFHAMRQATVAGDLVVLSLELGVVNGERNAPEQILRHYQTSRATDALLARPLRFLDGPKTPLQFTAARDDARFSTFPDTFTVYARAFVDGREIVTAYSNRLNLDVLIAQFARQGFVFEGDHHLTSSKFYRYLVFRKAPLISARDVGAGDRSP